MLSKQLTGSHSVFLVSFDISASSVCPRVILDLMVTETRHLKIFVIGIRYQVRATTSPVSGTMETAPLAASHVH